MPKGSKATKENKEKRSIFVNKIITSPEEITTEEINKLTKGDKDYIFNNTQKPQLEKFLNRIFKAPDVDFHIKKYFYLLATPRINDFLYPENEEIGKHIINSIDLIMDDDKHADLNEIILNSEDNDLIQAVIDDVNKIYHETILRKRKISNIDKEFVEKYKDFIDFSDEENISPSAKNLNDKYLYKLKMEEKEKEHKKEIEKEKAKTDKITRALADKINKEKDERKEVIINSSSESEALTPTKKEEINDAPINELIKKMNELNKIPKYKELINKLYIDEAYEMRPDKLKKELILKYGVSPENADALMKNLYNKVIDKTFKHKESLKKFLDLRGYNPQAYEFLPNEIKEQVEKFNKERFDEELRRKNIKYILPKELPHWEKAMKEYNLNPMLSRGSRVLYKD